MAENQIVSWYKNEARIVFEKTESPETLAEFDRHAQRILELEKNQKKNFPICLIGQAGVGKSTLINALISKTDIVVPSGGGTGPLTANVLKVAFGDNPSFLVRYHAKQQLRQIRFSLEREYARKNGETTETEEQSLIVGPVTEVLEVKSDEQDEKKIDYIIRQTNLLIGNSQSAGRELKYLIDAIRWILGEECKHGTEFVADDKNRMAGVQNALKHDTEASAMQFSEKDYPDFYRHLRDHACGFLAPMILDMQIHWPSDLLIYADIVDLPGIGVLNDAHAKVTEDYLRNHAKAVMLVTDKRGIKREDAEFLKNTGFLNRLLHSCGDRTDDPVRLFIVVTQVDNVAVENWRNDRQTNSGVARETKEQHFLSVVEKCRADIRYNLESFLKEVWIAEEGEGFSEGKESVIRYIMDTLQVFPVSAPQYSLHHIGDEDDRPFLKDIGSTNIPALQDAVQRISQSCYDEQTQRFMETEDRFFGQLRARLNVLSAQQDEETRASEECEKFRAELAGFVAPKQKEFSVRMGGFRTFLRKTMPVEIEAKVEVSAQIAEKSIRQYLRRLQEAHWATLRAAVTREGTFYGSRYINLPEHFSLTFEAPVAEVWSKELLPGIRRETKEFAEYQSEVVQQVLAWAKQQGIRVSTKLLEALVEEVQQHKNNVNAVGKEAIKELQEKVRAELIKKIEGPIRRRCKKFVDDGDHIGPGVKWRILNMFNDLGSDVVASAKEPAKKLLIERFEEVHVEILSEFKDHSDPISEAAEKLSQQFEKKERKRNEQFIALLNNVLAKQPERRGA